MQLTKSNNLATRLATATCMLIGTTPLHAQEVNNTEAWKFDTAILYYGETDRVSLVEGIFSASKNFGDDRIFTGKLTYDGLTGASATGSVPQNMAQTFGRPSGKGSYEVPANTTPLDDTFRDSRVQLNAAWSQPLANDMTGGIGLHISNEYDYLSVGLNGNVAVDFNQKNTTLSTGLSVQYDQIDPVGGTPQGLSSLPLYIESEVYEDEYDDDHDDHDDHATPSESKTTVDGLFGITQVINKRTIMQLNYGFSIASGYLNDPYKFVSVVDDTGTVQDTLYELRPDKRTKHNIFWQTKYAMDNGVIDVSYRYMLDDWDITSHTIDSRLRFNIGKSSYIQPHLRYYTQSKADFYQPFLLESSPLPMFVSADYRLGEMDAITVGLKFGQSLDNGQKWAFRLEYYQQNPKNAGFVEPGQLQAQDLYPSINAVIAQLSYTF